MKSEVERLEGSRVRLKITVDDKEWETGIQKAYRKLVKKLNVPGFRKGKAPRMIIERYYGKEVFYQDALDELIPGLYEQACEEQNINPIGEPQMELESIAAGEPISFSITTDIYPSVELGEYKGLPVEKERVVVSDNMVKSELERMQEAHRRLVPIEDRDTVADGDFVVIDAQGYIDGEPFSGGAVNDHELEIGSGTFVPGFEEQLVGTKQGDSVEIAVTFPENYHEELAGKDAVFKVQIKEIKAKQLPDLDDDLAKEAGDYETFADLEADVRKQMSERLETRSRDAALAKLLQTIKDGSTIEIPETIVQHQLENTVQRFRISLVYQGLSLEQYLEQNNLTIDSLKKDMEPDAIATVQREMILDKIAEEEGLQATDVEVDEEMSSRLQGVPSAQREEEEKHLQEQRSSLEVAVSRRKVEAFLLDSADISEVDPDSESETVADEVVAER